MSSWRPKKPPFRKHKQYIFEKLSKTASFIYHIGESENLRKPSMRILVKDITSETTQKKIRYIKKCFKKYRKLTGMGRGLAGVQVGIREQIIAIYLSDKEQLSFLRKQESRFWTSQNDKKFRVKPGMTNNENMLVMINPKITKQSKKCLSYREICMSAAPLIANVVRPSWIECEYYDENGKKQCWDLKDRKYNRVLQHEIDHLHGIINIDRVDSKSLIFEVDPKFYEKKARFKKARNQS